MSVQVPSVEQVHSIVIKQGPQGPPGIPGTSGTGTPFSQDFINALSVSVQHLLNRYPVAVIVYDQTDAEVDKGVNVIDLNTIEVTFAFPTSGKVIVT